MSTAKKNQGGSKPARKPALRFFHVDSDGNDTRPSTSTASAAPLSDVDILAADLASASNARGGKRRHEPSADGASSSSNSNSNNRNKIKEDPVMLRAAKRARQYHRGLDQHAQEAASRGRPTAAAAADSDDDDHEDQEGHGDQDDQDDEDADPVISMATKEHTKRQQNALLQGVIAVNPSSAVPDKQSKGKGKGPSKDQDDGQPSLNSTVKAMYKNVDDKKLKARLEKNERQMYDSAMKAARAEVLLPAEAGFLEADGIEKTYQFKQAQIAANVDMSSANKMFELDLPTLGPYRMSYTRNGRHMVIAGKKGHVATFDWKTGKLGCELHLMETCRDVKWLHNETMFAVAQKKYVYIYDHSGTEIHCLRKHIDVNRLDFLPYHFLLVSVGNAGYLKYQDTSTGQLVVEHRTKLGSCDVMRHNPYNAVELLGHTNGTVTMWSPNMTTPLVKMLCHRCMYMTTAGLDGQMKVWDLRTYKELHSYYTPTPATSLDISQSGLLAVGHGPHIQVWKDALATKVRSPYMSHLVAGSIVSNMQFCPFEDVLGVGHARGISSLLVPGAGEANFDALEANPLQTKKQRQEAEVKSLLDKLQPNMITLDPWQLGTLRRNDANTQMAAAQAAEQAEQEAGMEYAPRQRSRGRSSTMRRYIRKQKNVMDENKLALKTKLDEERKARIQQQAGPSAQAPSKPTALDRFSFTRR
ncbi:U3 snoRNP-associated protein Utp7 [Capsaspora owczarzaki ATCC 30864]|uniref:U3 snoRNP-associated protein Utp7 n=1 Tax=Capsaspora owczarzaki (strain ATCC 30864) TaxID=595528 RepID=A0A0D2VMH0_CAPO3|nr:U3 snoRNP-associated protein Utp7 [Capsaspora owczarzaki ATCC 30864]KJE91362.1 U3 snoRNP-associated protein Utp7 [Capsaspora owczarzaki ATCC 30864]|eukprot:XP_004349256.2 U3 snoRNP-associated protein Utp7 [Capsaspora owczarzaki ATCC 30864]